MDLDTLLKNEVMRQKGIVSFVYGPGGQNGGMIFTCMIRNDMEGQGSTPTEALKDALYNSQQTIKGDKAQGLH